MEEKSSETFGALLKRYRTARGWTQVELAEQSGISAYSISNLERGAPRRPRHDTLHLLARALDLLPKEREIFVARGRGYRTATDRRLSDQSTPHLAPALCLESLPLPPTPLIGREEEMACALTDLARPQVRLLTLVGPAGCGKTHLGLQIARQAAERYPDGVGFVSLAPVRDPILLVSAVAAALGLQERGDEGLLETLTSLLSTRHLLLLLDNFEHLGVAAPQIAAWLETCPQLQVLVTSRRALHLRGEHELSVPPLALPDLRALPSLADLAHIPALELFLQRASAVAPSFELTQANAASLAAICCQLDGLPLAIELAAPLVKLLTPELLLRRLAHRLDLLVDGPCDLPERQRSLRATLAWSYDLLSPPEQALFRRLAVFVGGATLEAVEAVCAADETAVPATTVVRLLAGLCAASLVVQRETPEGGARFSLLETIREYGWEGLVSQREAHSTQEQHASYYLTLAEAAERQVRGPEQMTWLSRLEEEHNNLRAALQWALSQHEITLGLRLAIALRPFWYMHGHLSEGRNWFEQFLAVAAAQETSLPASLYAKALNGVGVLAFAQGDFEHAVVWYEQSLASCQREQDQVGIGAAYHNLGILAQEQGELDRARELYQQALAIQRALGDRLREAAGLSGLGIVARRQGNLAQARAWHEASLVIRREIGDETGIASSLNNLGTVAVDEGDYDRAAELLEEALAIRHHQQDRREAAEVLVNLAAVARLRGEYAEAQLLAEEAAALYQQTEDNAGLAVSLITLASIACAQEDVARVAALSRKSLQLCNKAKARTHIAECLERLAFVACKLGWVKIAAQRLGSAAALRESMGVPIEPRDKAFYDTVTDQLHRQLGPDHFRTCWVAGREQPLDKVIDEALTEEVPKSAGRPAT
jgi:predicted ATPase/transcriptional regulator with XRE-family HTH domain/Tfp pilus assembly protein PilF